MNKNETEKDKLYQWACEHSTKDRKESIFTPVNKECRSYYEYIINKDYIREYEPDNAQDIKKELISMWEKNEIFDHIQLICTVACMKNKYVAATEKAVEHEKSGKQLKPYIYEF